MLNERYLYGPRQLEIVPTGRVEIDLEHLQEFVDLVPNVLNVSPRECVLGRREYEFCIFSDFLHHAR